MATLDQTAQPTVFDKDWFQKHQSKLLWLLNTPVIKRWFRYVMRIRKEDLPLKTKILEFGVNHFTHSAKLIGDKVELQTSFRSNEKYARRLYFAFKPLWLAFHAWDMVTKPIPSLNLGFDTMTAYSTPTSTVSGNALRDDGTYPNLATIRAGAGTSNRYDGGTGYDLKIILQRGGTGDRVYELGRGIFLFDCSALGATVTISAAVIGLYGVSGQMLNQAGSPEVDIVASNPASNTVLVNSDYGTLSTTPFSSHTYAEIAGVGDAYNSFTLDANGIANVSKTGISKFGITLNWDTDNNNGSSGSAYETSSFAFMDGGYTGTTQDPKIDITYTLPSTGYANLLLLGVG